MNGIELAARFALPPNSKGYCGGERFVHALKRYFSSPMPLNAAKLWSELKKFKAHYSYLRLIAGANGLKPFDARVSEAFWLGNSLLGKVKKKELQSLITNEFSGKGMLPKKKARKLASSLPDNFVPHHSFHVLYLHTISGVIEKSVKNADMCRVSWGKVRKVEKGGIEVKTQRLARVKGKLALLPAVKRWKTSCAGIALLPDAKPGDIVASHWGFATMKISWGQAKELKKATEKNVRAANSL